MNFDYLKSIPQLEKLYISCTQAEQYLLTDANISAAAARRSIEYIVKLIYSSAVTPYIEGLSVYEMLTDPLFMRHMDDPELINEIHAIRRIGNCAVHEGNVGEKDAENAVKKLFHVIGEACVFLGLIESYPAFDLAKIKSLENGKSQSEIELEISNEFVSILHTRILKHPSLSQSRTPVNVHIPAKERIQSQIGVDPATNSRKAALAAADYLKENLPQVQVDANRLKGTISLKAKNGATIVAAVKSGCPQLGSAINGKVVLLPEIDYVLYAPDFRMEDLLISQLRVFAKDDFLQMWQSLGLIRMKVSSARVKEMQKLYGSDFNTHIQEHADVISVQSFSNSGRKKSLVWAEFEKRPLLAGNGMDIIAKALKMDR